MIQVINRALDILEFMAQDSSKEYNLGEIAEKMSLNHSTCANIIKSMTNRGYIESLGKKRGYRLGDRLYQLVNNTMNRKELIEASAIPVKELKDKLNETTMIAVLKGSIRTVILKETCLHDLQANSPDVKDAYRTATGRLLLAHLNEQERDQFIRKYGLPDKGAWKEVKNKKNLITEMDKIKSEGFVIHYADSNIIGIALPIYKGEKVVASLGVYLPEVRFSFKKQVQIISSMKITAKQITTKL